MGDVCGKGPDAAAVTALARYTLRAAAMRERLPSRSLGLLNEALLRQRTDRRFCTVAYAYMQVVPGHVRLELACGGHPLPFVVHRRSYAAMWDNGARREPLDGVFRVPSHPDRREPNGRDAGPDRRDPSARLGGRVRLHIARPADVLGR